MFFNPLNLRIGQGYDVHKLVEGRELWLCGIKIPHSSGLLGHSDADVAIHSLCDAILGAAGLRDIGYHFPDSDAEYKGIDSKILLKKVIEKITKEGWILINADLTIMAQAPKLSPHIEEMKWCLSETMNVTKGQVNIKATTTEKLGFTGRQEGIASQAVALLYKCNSPKI